MTRLLLVLASALVALAAAGGAGAQTTAETELVEKWAPVLKLKAQEEMCGDGEPYEPIDIDAILDNDEVMFRGPWDKVNVVGIGPGADDLAQGFVGYHLDFPGKALEPECEYEEFQERISEVSSPTVYGRVVAEPAYPDRLAVQYWFYYVFNDFNNLHEGDWEMIQLNFDAGTVEEALAREPAELGYSQHEGAERAEWGADKLDVVDGTHPVVYPASGSHANFFTSAIFLGRSAAQGVGCDDTSGPSRDLDARVAVIPSASDEYLEAFPWLAFEGRWGEKEAAFFNGPTGPNTKRQWTEPIGWSEEEWRDQAFKLPGSNTMLPAATDFFCEAVGAGSTLLIKVTLHPQAGLFLLASLVAVLIWGLTRTTWRPGAPLRLARRRSTGQVLTASRRMYARHFTLFAGIGVIFIPIAVLLAGLQAVLFFLTSLDALQDAAGETNPFVTAFATGISLIFNLVVLGLVQAVVARAMTSIDNGRPPRAIEAYRQVLPRERFRALAGAVLLITAVTVLLTLTFFLIPIAVWLLVRWSLTGQAVELDRLGARAAVRRSSELVGGHWWRTLLLLGGVAVVATISGPLIGALALLGSDAAFWVVNLIAAIIYVFAFPFVAIVATYIYHDFRVRKELEPEGAQVVLDAELPTETMAADR